MDRRQNLLQKVCGKNLDDQSMQYAELTAKLLLTDMCSQFQSFWDKYGRGVMILQPENKEEDNQAFWLTPEALESAKRHHSDNSDIEDVFQNVIDTVVKLDPALNACYLLIDKEGMRFFVVDITDNPLNKTIEV